MKKNNSWFSLVIAMWLVLIITLLAFTVLEYIIPFSRDIKWIENSSKAYYQANSWIEKWLYKIYERNWSWDIDDRNEFSKNFSWIVTDEFITSSSWLILPPNWEGNSEYDKDWDKISQWNPIQLYIWDWYISDFSNIKIAFRVPKIDIIPTTLSWAFDFPIINWQLSSDNSTLNASWGIIKTQDILKSNNFFSNTNISLNNLQWTDLIWLEQSLWSFYSNNCITWSKCSLKFSLVNKIETDDWKILPYLEWKMDLGSNNIPLRYTKLESSWKSYWFKKDIIVKIPSKTVNEAFDFTVFQ